MTATSEAVASEDYRVDLAVFHGPLDLLLHLIRKEEVDIYDIPIARITRQYLKYIDLMQTLNLEVAGEFVLMAATLIRIKARWLLPRDENDPDEADPREELIQALMEYKKYKEAGEILKEKAILEERNFVPDSPVEKIDPRIDEYSDITLFDLISAFKDVIEAKHEETFHEVDAEDFTVEQRMEFIMQALTDQEFATFTQLFSDIPRKIVAVVTFIALLELTRARRVVLAQSKPFAQLRVYRGDRFAAKKTS
ncbi:MAG: segregation/condensation protein A, partial [candidate division Zixibacteria bacterium]|nr:segregation/condensation protein A [candidate division Zixibacteria bacterium]